MFVKKTRENLQNGIILHSFLFVFEYSDLEKTNVPMIPVKLNLLEAIAHDISKRVDISKDLDMDWTFWDRFAQPLNMSDVKGTVFQQIREFDHAMEGIFARQYDASIAPPVIQNLMDFGLYIRIAKESDYKGRIDYNFDKCPFPHKEFFDKYFRLTHETNRNKKLSLNYNF